MWRRLFVCIGLCSIGCAGAAVQPARQLEAGELMFSASGLLLHPLLMAGQGQLVAGFGVGDAALNMTLGAVHPKAGASLRLYATEWFMIGGQLEYQTAGVNETDTVLNFCDGYGTHYVQTAYGRVMTNATKLRGFYAGFLYGHAWRSGVAKIEDIKSKYPPACEEMFYADDFNSLGSGGRLIVGFYLPTIDAGSVQIELMFPIWTHPNTRGVVPWDGTAGEFTSAMWGAGMETGFLLYNNILSVTYSFSFL